jgi:hypothetical protein
MNINEILCHETAKNTGFCDCVLELKNIVNAFKVPKGTRLTKTQLQSSNIVTTLKAMTYDIPSKRLYPVAQFTDFKDNSEKPVYASYGYGKGEYVRDGQVKWEFEFRKGGLSLSNALRSFNGSQSSHDVLFIDSKNQLIGTIAKNATTGAIEMAGIPVDNCYTMPMAVANGKDPSKYMVAMEFDPIYINENVAVMQYATTDFLLKDEIVGLKNINLTQTAITTSTIDVALATDCGDDIKSTYANELSATGSWIAKNTTTGAVLTIVSVATSTTGWLITLSLTDPNIPAVGSKISISLAPAYVLYLSGVIPYEGINTLTYIRP